MFHSCRAKCEPSQASAGTMDRHIRCAARTPAAESLECAELSVRGQRPFAAGLFRKPVRFPQPKSSQRQQKICTLLLIDAHDANQSMAAMGLGLYALASRAEKQKTLTIDHLVRVFCLSVFGGGLYHWVELSSITPACWCGSAQSHAASPRFASIS